MGDTEINAVKTYKITNVIYSSESKLFGGQLIDHNGKVELDAPLFVILDQVKQRSLIVDGVHYGSSTMMQWTPEESLKTLVRKLVDELGCCGYTAEVLLASIKDRLSR